MTAQIVSILIPVKQIYQAVLGKHQVDSLNSILCYDMPYIVRSITIDGYM